MAAPLVPDEPYLRAEVLVAVRFQGARGLSDVLVRRLRLTAEVTDRGRAAAEAALPIIATELGWDEARAAAELAAFDAESAEHVSV